MLKDDYRWWIISPHGGETNTVINIGGFGCVSTTYAYFKEAVRPVLFLKANLQLIGSGTQADPYKILS